MKKYTLTSYYGGKHHQLIPIMKIIGILGKYNTARAFVECFGGGGRCVLNQEYARYPFTKVLYNELDPICASCSVMPHLLKRFVC